ncbi:hypothetical protein POTOM_006030 [Populus tomentosa]|uniref:Uncharacterized protein n=1 Tax=Populus tomentosa TaxID=118781 RepID=A0A8X8AI71_POPTO|nr:hypothetical protein POTOM_006030 [Populus tomentosa]
MPELQLFPHTPKLLYLSLLFLLALFTICNADSVSGLNSLKTSEIDVIVSKGCSEKIGECFEESEMESEISRRVLLMQKKYISYETLRRDLVPCDKPGASYYDCNARQAHPYSRGSTAFLDFVSLWDFLGCIFDAYFGELRMSCLWKTQHSSMEDLRQDEKLISNFRACQSYIRCNLTMFFCPNTQAMRRPHPTTSYLDEVLCLDPSFAMIDLLKWK